MRTIKTINNKEDYQHALNRLEEIFDAKKGSPEGNELEQLGKSIEEYENKYFPFPPNAKNKTSSQSESL